MNTTPVEPLELLRRVRRCAAEALGKLGLPAASGMFLEKAIGDLDRYLDPIVTVRVDDKYWTPNGHHRLSAMRALGAKSIMALVVVDPKVAYRILALNTEKAHNLKEKSLEVIPTVAPDQ